MSATDVRPRRSDGPPSVGSRADEAERFAQRKRRARRLRWLRRLLIVAVLAAIAWGVWAVCWSSLFGVRRVAISGEHRSTAARIADAAQVPMDRPLVRVDTQAIAHRVASVPTVAHVDVTTLWPHTVRIVVVERVPVAVVHRGSERRLVDAQGVDFAPAPGRPPYPLLDVDVAAVAQVRAGLATIKDLPPALEKRVSSVQVLDPTDVRLLLGDGTTVYWGSSARTVDKAEVFAALVKTDPTAKAFDVSAPDAPTVRP